jgi:hypothetical protein
VFVEGEQDILIEVGSQNGIGIGLLSWHFMRESRFGPMFVGFHMKVPSTSRAVEECSQLEVGREFYLNLGKVARYVPR